MFQVTEAAAAQLDQARRDRGLPDTTGVRVSAEGGDGNQLIIGMGFAQVPSEDDQITEQDGTKVFVAAEVADVLSEVVLDLHDTPDGPRLILTRPGAD